jgi:hypothetical protein
MLLKCSIMKTIPGNQSLAFTLLECAVLVATVALLTTVLILLIGKTPYRANTIHCVNRLMQIGIATRNWQEDHHGKPSR